MYTKFKRSARLTTVAALAAVAAAVLSAATARPAVADSPPARADSSPATRPAGDPARGRLLFAACRTCHYPERGYGHHNGPGLYAIFGKQAGTQAGFPYYSAALKNSKLVWTPALLDSWLANPQTFLPETNMMFVGIPEARDRADLIAYLATFRD